MTPLETALMAALPAVTGGLLALWKLREKDRQETISHLREELTAARVSHARLEDEVRAQRDARILEQRSFIRTLEESRSRSSAPPQRKLSPPTGTTAPK